MSKITVESKLEINGRLLPVNAQGEGKGCYVSMLKTIDDQMTAMLSHHNKVLMIRLDVHVGGYSDDNAKISDYIRRVRRWAYDHYNTNRMGYVWCREQERAKWQHYHLLFMIDGNKARTSHAFISKCKEIAARHGLHVPNIDEPYKMVKRADAKAYNEVFYRASYLAKERGKGYKGKFANDFAASQIKLKADTSKQPVTNEHHSEPLATVTANNPVMADDERQIDWVNSL